MVCGVFDFEIRRWLDGLGLVLDFVGCVSGWLRRLWVEFGVFGFGIVDVEGAMRACAWCDMRESEWGFDFGASSGWIGTETQDENETTDKKG